MENCTDFYLNLSKHVLCGANFYRVWKVMVISYAKSSDIVIVYKQTDKAV